MHKDDIFYASMEDVRPWMETGEGILLPNFQPIPSFPLDILPNKPGISAPRGVGGGDGILTYSRSTMAYKNHIKQSLFF